MNKIKEIINNRKFVVVVIALLMMVTLITGTYAWFTWSNNSSENTSLTMTIGRLADVTFTSGNDINTGLTPVFNYTDGESTTFSIDNRDTSGTTINYVVKLNVTSLPVISDDNESIEALKSLKYVLLKGEEVVAENSLSGVSNGDSIDIYTGSMSTSGTQEFTFYIYIDGNMENPSSMMNTTFVGELMVEASAKVETFVDYLTNLYMSASPAQATVANNEIYYYYAPSVNMMNDGMNASYEWEDGANTGNIRYYGSAPANYIDIGDRDSSGNVIPWRIIGVFKNMKLADDSTDTLVKVIRDESIGNMAWDDDLNDWNNATLKTYLNEGEYYTGLSQNIKDKIARVEWNLGGYNDIIYSNDIYGYERGELKSDDSFKTVWEGNIALMYPSDYGYAADLTKCSQFLYKYNTDTTNCTGTDWMYYDDIFEWFLTPNSSNSDGAWDVYNGSVGEYTVVDFGIGVRPVLYLNSDLVRVSGDGKTVESAYVVR